MKKTIKIFVIMLLLMSCKNSYSQITKGYWLMGGSGYFGNFKSSRDGISYESTSFRIAPNIGYFVIDKLAFGTSGELSYTFDTANSKEFTPNSIAPFLRYYLLDIEKTVNIFSEISYQIRRLNYNDLKEDTFKFKAGGVFFLNNSVGIEVAINYSKLKSNDNFENRAIFLNIGFQVHLEKE